MRTYLTTDSDAVMLEVGQNLPTRQHSNVGVALLFSCHKVDHYCHPRMQFPFPMHTSQWAKSDLTEIMGCSNLKFKGQTLLCDEPTYLSAGTIRVILGVHHARIRSGTAEDIRRWPTVRSVSKRHSLVTEGCDWFLDLLREAS